MCVSYSERHTVVVIEVDVLGPFHTRCSEFLRNLDLLSNAITRSCLSSGNDCRLDGDGHTSPGKAVSYKRDAGW